MKKLPHPGEIIGESVQSDPSSTGHNSGTVLRTTRSGGVSMSAITATEARKSLFGLIQQVNEDHTTVEVVSRRGNAVIMSKDDFDALTETAYLLRNPANAERLLEAVERARRGEFEQHDLLDA